MTTRQVVTAEGGYAYGVIGADLHVVSGRGPVYLLANYAPAAPEPTQPGLPAQPSYLLNARSAVVDFVGRRDEVRDLTNWRDSDHPLAVCWLHGPGGQGKTRLAAHLADDAVRCGWKVIVADHTAGKVDARSPTSQDLRLGAATGLLLVVDYADRWPLAHLTWLFSNKVLNQDAPVRVLLLARTAHVWPALCHALAQAGWPPDSRTTHQLSPLPSTPDSRSQMFTAARDSFVSRYRLPDPHVIRVPAGLDRDEFGLTLAVHMAALVAVDRHAHTAAQPPLEDMTGLTTYLLDRERHHWHTLYDGRAPFDTTPEQMSRAVFTAALTGPLGYRDAKTALDTVGIGTDADRVLADHAFCYPPADPRTVLEPLYPDRLAEDFLALCLPGHHIPGPWAGAWADDAPTVLLTPTADGGPLPPYASRAITFLTAASDRWSHLIPTLAALETFLPNQTRGALTIAAGDLTARLANHRLATTTDPAERARIHLNLGQRLDPADHGEKAMAAFQEAVRLYRPLAEADPRAFEPGLADALYHFAVPHLRIRPGEHWTTAALKHHFQHDRRPPTQLRDEATAALAEAVEIYRRLVEHDPDGGMNYVALVGALAGMGRWQEVGDSVDVMLAHLRQRRQENPAAFDLLLAGTLYIHVLVLERLDRLDEAVTAAAEAVDIRRRLAQHDPAEHEAELQSAVKTHARVLYTMERHGEALRVIREAVRIARRLARVNPAEHETELRSALETLVQLLVDQERWDEALPDADEAVQLTRRLAHDDPGRHEESLACNLSVLALVLRPLNRRDEEAAALEEAVSIRRRLARENPAEHEQILCSELGRLGTVLAETGRWRDALAVTAEAVEILDRLGGGDQLGVEANLTVAVGVLTGQEWRGSDAFPGLAEALEEARRHFADHNPAGLLYRQLTGADLLAAEPLRPDAARVITERRQRVEGNPDHLPDLAALLGSHALTLRSLGRHDEALSPASEAAQLYHRLAQDDPRTYEPMLVDAMMRAAVIMGELGTLSAEAVAAAIGIRRRLAQHDRARHEPALAAELAIMARTLAKHGRWTEAVASATESFEIRRRLGASVEDSLTAAEEFLTTHLATAELRTEYLAALHAAVAARRATS